MKKKRIRDREANLEKELILAPENLKRRKKKKYIRLSIVIFCGLIAAVGILFASFEVVRAIGKYSLNSKTAAAMPKMEQAEPKSIPSEMEETQWKEGWVKYENVIYEYNKDILTFLFMGIDKSSNVIEVAEGTEAGQADALFLLVLNPHDKTIKVIGINRNTMTDVDLYNESGDYTTTVTAQIAVQHGFGNGLEESCEYQVNAVKRLFYNLPIHGYCAINMDAVISLTDLAGGMELTALEDVKTVMPKEDQNAYIARNGETVFLDGKKAYSYVRYRDMNAAGSADKRLERQRQFLEEFISKVKTGTAKDITLPVKLYHTISSKMVTDVTVDEVTYLASIAVDYSFEKDQLYSLKGETVQGETFEEYYVEEDTLFKLILDIFYEPVEN